MTESAFLLAIWLFGSTGCRRVEQKKCENRTRAIVRRLHDYRENRNERRD